MAKTFLNGVNLPQTPVMTFAGTLLVTTGSSRYYFSQACKVNNIIISVGTAPTGASIIVDINKNGTTIFSTQGNRPTIAISGFSDTSSIPDIIAFAAGDYLTVDIDQIGSTIPGSNLVVQIVVT